MLFVAAGAVACLAQPDRLDESDGLAAGLVATFGTGDGGAAAITRIDPDVQFNWEGSSPDLRVPAERFRVVWRGRLWTPGSRKYRFHLFLVGKAAVSIGGRKVIDGATDRPGWLSSAPIELEQGHQPIDVEYSKTERLARIGLYWESSAWPLEPITPRWLFHEPAGGEAIDRFDRGHELARAYRCGACHEVPGSDALPRAPSLAALSGRVHAAWLVDRLAESPPHGAADPPASANPASRMPAFGLTRDQSRAVAAYLLKGKAAAAPETPKARADVGENLVRSLGCLACHTLGDAGQSGLFGGGALNRIAEKRPPQFFRDWLRKPEQLNPDHRMPVFNLTAEEVGDIAAFLATLGRPADRPADDDANRELVAEGKQIIDAARCAACHEIPGIDRPATSAGRLDFQDGRKSPGAGTSGRRDGCLGEPDVARHRPGFQLSRDDRTAVREFIAKLPAKPAPLARYEVGRRLLRESNCTSCHARDLDPGLQPATIAADKAGDQEAELAKLRGELEPPSLSSVGDKFTDETLAKLIHGGQPARRPWLRVRMPRFAHNDADRDAIASYLIDHDRIPLDPPSSILHPQTAPTLDPAAALTAGHHLVSARGFGCMSCHTVGRHEPKGVAVNARGSDLLAMGNRLRHEWFLRWTRDPARIVPGMEMPSITVPAPGVLDGRLDHQLEALWQSLNSPAFVVPSDRDTAQQVISLKPGDDAAVLRDVMFDCPPSSGWCPRSFAIGLPGRHNVLFDLDTMSLRSWWFGDFARERTEGKSWLWEAGGLPAWRGAKPHVLALRHMETANLLIPKQPPLAGRLKTWMRGYAHGTGEPVVALWYRLVFDSGLELDVRDWIFDRPDQRGFDREVAVYNVPNRYEPVLLAVGNSNQDDRKELRAEGPLGPTVLRELSRGKGWLKAPATPGGDHSTGSFVLPLRVLRVLDEESNDYITHVSYVLKGPDVPASLKVATESPASAPLRRATLPVLPGYEVVRLPLAPTVMPSALTFRPDSTLVACSLKGGVFYVRDSDADGFEDAWVQISDHLAAPFGVLACGDDLIISHKPELLRLNAVDRELEGRVTFADVIASGWGYNEDYHDWTFGVLSDAFGYYIATASDYAQKGRPKSAQGLRGHLLRVSIDGKLETLARGLRYPTGLAMNRDGAIFFTDNQGVQNTFNEINHVIPGSRYGVPSLDDPPPEKDPWPAREPAIKIPHPWMRSVNGICFLDGPTEETRDAVREKWGPYGGHGVGCEYDTRALMRFTLQKIGDTYQGACYPFTLPEDQVPPDQRLLGPISCAVSPGGDLYVGGIRDSGWGGGSNVGELVRIRPSAAPPLGIREVRATGEGFAIDFTGPIDATAAADHAKFVISSYRRIWKGAYATPDSDRRTEQIRRIEVAADRHSVVVTLNDLRPGFVYDIHVSPIGPNATPLWPADAYYTLNQVPPK
jgi:mono/diheme cytochrome c family protein